MRKPGFFIKQNAASTEIFFWKLRALYTANLIFTLILTGWWAPKALHSSNIHINIIFSKEVFQKVGFAGIFSSTMVLFSIPFSVFLLYWAIADLFRGKQLFLSETTLTACQTPKFLVRQNKLALPLSNINSVNYRGGRIQLTTTEGLILLPFTFSKKESVYAERMVTAISVALKASRYNGTTP